MMQTINLPASTQVEGTHHLGAYITYFLLYKRCNTCSMPSKLSTYIFFLRSLNQSRKLNFYIIKHAGTSNITADGKQIESKLFPLPGESVASIITPTRLTGR